MKTTEQVHDRAFSIAAATNAQTFSAFQSALNASLQAGEIASQFAVRLDAVLAARPADAQALANPFSRASLVLSIDPS